MFLSNRSINSIRLIRITYRIHKNCNVRVWKVIIAVRKCCDQENTRGLHYNSIISRTMMNIRSLRMYVRGVNFEQLLDMQKNWTR